MPERPSGAGGIGALILGSITGVAVFFLGDFANPEGFGVSRLGSGFIDLVSAPVLLPFGVYLILLFFRGPGNFGAFALLWLIPDMAIRLVGWSVQNNPLFLVLVPVLRSAVALGLSSCISLIMTKKIGLIIPAVLGILLLPLSGAACYWLFFSQVPFWGFLLLGVTAFPGLAGIVVLLYQKCK